MVFCVNEIITEYQLLPVESMDACLNHWILSFRKYSFMILLRLFKLSEPARNFHNS